MVCIQWYLNTEKTGLHRVGSTPSLGRTGLASHWQKGGPIPQLGSTKELTLFTGGWRAGPESGCETSRAGNAPSAIGGIGERKMPCFPHYLKQVRNLTLLGGIAKLTLETGKQVSQS